MEEKWDRDGKVRVLGNSSAGIRANRNSGRIGIEGTRTRLISAFVRDALGIYTPRRMSSEINHRQPPKVPDHELVRIIGRGSYGEIWLARSLTGVMRAVKLVDRSTFDSEKSFQREFEGMARFEPISREHDGFVDILHVGRDEECGFFYYVMELADDHVGGSLIDESNYVPKTLKTELGRRSRLLADECVTLGLSLTEALAALHREDLVHRDIKPANIIFVGGRPKIADIGLVAAAGQDSFVGTEGYVPPEGHGSVQADLYSLGKVLYEIAMGKDRMDFPALNTQLDRLPDKETLLRLNDVLLRACASDLTERYIRAEQMHEDLVRIRNGRPLATFGRRRWPLIAAGVALVAVGALGAYFARLKTARGAVGIDTDPSGAMVLIDGQMKHSPARFEALPVGEHSMRVMLPPDYEPVVKNIQVQANADLTVPKLTLRHSRGVLELGCKAPGATFELRQGERVVKTGSLPARIDDLWTGEYALLARLDGREKKVGVEIKRAEVTMQDLEFAVSKVNVASLPPGAEIFVDGQRAGLAPLELTLAEENEHELVARYRTWPEQRRTFKPHDAQPEERFEFQPGSVKITSLPSGAGIFSKGKLIGQTPRLIENIEPGEVRYELRLAGYVPLEFKDVVKPGEQTFLGKHLARRAGPMPGQPWENSLGMRFLPLGDILMSVWPTRVQDFGAFCQATARKRIVPDFTQDNAHPVVLVTWDDATAFCEWLTQKEIAAEQIAEGEHYRLPTDVEWSRAAGLPEEGGASPQDRDGKVKEFPWGKQWPPPAGSGNFADATLRRSGTATIPNYRDGFAQTSPVGAFPANKLGFYDLSGNVWQWCLEPYKPGSHWGVLRGGSWANAAQAELYMSCRNVIDRSERDVIYGFRCVLVPESSR
jgi:eukaryotic-like serine/threonine-protein kinase